MEHKGTAELVTGRLVLRRFKIEDAAAMFKNYAADARVTRFLSWEPYETAEAVEGFIKKLLAEYEKKDFYHWAMEHEGEVVGSISVVVNDERNEACEVGYCIACDRWGMGLTAEALSAVLAFLFDEVGYHRVFAKHDVENPASGRVMEKCGMTFEGRLRGHYRRGGGSYSDALLYAVLAEDFSGQKRL